MRNEHCLRRTTPESKVRVLKNVEVVMSEGSRIEMTRQAPTEHAASGPSLSLDSMGLPR